eukprot:2158232-Rhodomonas_salina.1
MEPASPAVVLPVQVEEQSNASEEEEESGIEAVGPIQALNGDDSSGSCCCRLLCVVCSVVRSRWRQKACLSLVLSLSLPLSLSLSLPLSLSAISRTDALGAARCRRRGGGARQNGLYNGGRGARYIGGGQEGAHGRRGRPHHGRCRTHLLRPVQAISDPPPPAGAGYLGPSSDRRGLSWTVRSELGMCLSPLYSTRSAAHGVCFCPLPRDHACAHTWLSRPARDLVTAAGTRSCNKRCRCTVSEPQPALQSPVPTTLPNSLAASTSRWVILASRLDKACGCGLSDLRKEFGGPSFESGQKGAGG